MRYKTHQEYLEEQTKHTHRAEVIEVYDNGQAAIRFRFEGRDKIESVIKAGMQAPFEIGQKGKAIFQRTLNGYVWSFDPSTEVK